MDPDPVRTRLANTADDEAFRPVAVGDIAEKSPAGTKFAVAVVRMSAPGVTDVQIHVAGVRVPREHKPSTWTPRDPNPESGQSFSHRRFPIRKPGDIGRCHKAQIFPENAQDASSNHPGPARKADLQRFQSLLMAAQSKEGKCQLLKQVQNLKYHTLEFTMYWEDLNKRDSFKFSEDAQLDMLLELQLKWFV